MCKISKNASIVGIIFLVLGISTMAGANTTNTFISPSARLQDTPLGSINGWTELAGCTVLGDVESKDLSGGYELHRKIQGKNESQRCLLIERILPTENGMHWEIEIRGEGEPWSTDINTRLQWKTTEGLTWWTAWGDNRPKAPEGKVNGSPKETDWWTDPLVPVPFADATLSYGSVVHTQPQAFCVPMVTILDAKADKAISLILSPEDLMLDMGLEVTGNGSMTFVRSKHRITPEHAITFSMDFVRHEADWRSGLAWMVNRYPQFFNPPNPNVQEMAGCGSYSSHSRDLDAELLRRMAFKVNWKASFDFPYMGMFIPPVPDDITTWTDFKSKTTSISRMRDDIRCFTDMGFYTLNYFNVTEFGAHIEYPPPPRKAERDEDLWKDPNDFLYGVLKDAILTRGRVDRPIPSWEGCVAMDPGDPVYQQFLVDQAQRHVEVFPESSGICIDRMDWLRYFNPKFDDGMSWDNDKPCRSLVISWHQIIKKISDIMHNNDKVIYCNPHYRRLDLTRYVDGIYDEFGQMGHSMNLCALLALRKPIMSWTIMTPELEKDPDAYFQRHLHMGAYLTAPLPGNDHTILPSDDINKLYLDYGPLLKALEGKQWILKPHAVEVVDNAAKANLFAVNEGYAVPVTFGEQASHVRIILRHLQPQPGQESFNATAIHPGETEWTPIPLTYENGVVSIDVPLERQCAMVKIQ